ncbi:hypothetical protein [Sphingopyxis sp. RIFCSPHIGHO2_12_FULL_65_19]|nr:hypothetical protein [Sphingopyxis sp. RIFCSPHIGHO2_12_FULL_65_19]
MKNRATATLAGWASASASASAARAAHGGDLTLANHAEGGLMARATLPL